MKIYKTNDHHLIARLNKTVQDLHKELYPGLFKSFEMESMNEAFERFMRLPQHDFYVVEAKGTAVGYAWAEIKEYKENAFKIGYRSFYIHQISIQKEHQAKGYGKALMNFLDIQARKKCASLIELDYWLGNSHAKEFYSRNGFTVSREFVYKKI